MTVMVMYGTDKDMLMVKEQEIKSQKRFEGCDVREIDGKKNTVQEIRNAFDTGLFDLDPIMVVVRNPTRIKKITELLESAPMDVLVIKEGDMVKSLQSFSKHQFQKPKAYMQEDDASEFLVEEMRKHYGITLDLRLSQAIIKRVGTDKGMLRFEGLKLAFCSEGEINPKDIIGVIAPLMERGGVKVKDAILNNDLKAFLSESDRFEKTSKSNPTMDFLNLFFKSLSTWIEILSRSKKQSAEEIGKEMGLSPYLVRSILLPKVKKLGMKKLKKMMRLIYETESVVLTNGVDPWSKFKLGMISIFF